MESTLRPIAEILSLNTDLVMNAVADLSESEAADRPVTGASSVRFLVAHLIDARYYLLKMLGSPQVNPQEESFRAVETIEDADALPLFKDMKKNWIGVSAHLVPCLEGVAAEVLNSVPEQPFPVDDGTVLGAVAFLTQHESYHAGQLGLLRKALGNEGISYDRKHAKRRDA